MSHRFAAETARGREAQLAWFRLPVRDRLRPVRRLRHLLVERADDLAAAARDDVGRRPGEFVATDVLPTAAACQFLERRAARVLAPRRVGGRPLWLLGCRDTVHRRPHGVVGVIGTWNYPLFLNAVPIAHALTAGNAVLWKPSERAPRSAAVLAELLAAAGFPPGLVVTLPADRDGGRLVAEADIDFVHFTGSEPVGRALAARLGGRLIPSALELSGNDAMFVLADADAELAARAARYGATLNDGRTCMAVRRAFVHRAALDRFRAAAPPVAVAAFDDLDAAVAEWAADPSRLTASVFTADARSADALAARLPVGAVVVNDVIVPTAHPGTPFGGRGASGWGVTQGAEGLLQMTVPQTVTVRRGTFRPHIDAAINGDPAADDVTRGMLRLAHAAGLRDRLGGFAQMVRGMRRSAR